MADGLDEWQPPDLQNELLRCLGAADDLLITGRLGSGRSRAAAWARRVIEKQGEQVSVQWLPATGRGTGRGRLREAARTRRRILVGTLDTRIADLPPHDSITQLSIHPWSRSAIESFLRDRAPGLPERMPQTIHLATGGHYAFLKRWVQAGCPADLSDADIWQAFVDRALDDLTEPTLRLAEELGAGFRLLGEPLAPTMTTSPDAAEVLLRELDGASLLGTDGELVPVAAYGIRRRLGGYRRHLLHRKLVAELTDPTDHVEILLELASKGMIDQCLARLLVRAADEVRLTNPTAALNYYAAATAAGSTDPRLHAGAAEASLAADDLTGALRESNLAMSSSSEEARRRGLQVAQSAWFGKGLPRRAVEVTERFGDSHDLMSSTTSCLTHLAVGNHEQAQQVWASYDDGLATLEELASKILIQALETSVTRTSAFPAALLPRLCQLGEEITVDHLLATGWVQRVAPLAYALGIHEPVRTMLRGLVDAEGASPQVEERLLLGWAELHTGHPTRAAECLAEARQHPWSVRTAVLAAGLEVSLCLHTQDRQGLAAAWPGAIAAVNQCDVDLFGLTCYPEFIVAAARLRQETELAPALERAYALLGRLGRPPVWTNLLDWAEVQAAIITDRPTRAKAPAQSLRQASATSEQAAALADAGATWIEVLARRFTPPDVFKAAKSLTDIGNRMDAARLAAHAAARCDDQHNRRELLDLARSLGTNSIPDINGESAAPVPGTLQLTERETQVAQLVVNRRNYREVGDALFLSPRTVENHVARMRRRAGVSSRGELLDVLEKTLRQSGHLD